MDFTMRPSIHSFSLMSGALPVMLAGVLIPAACAQTVPEIGGEKIVTLTRTPTSTTRPEFTSITLAPGRGMEVLQITANFPGKGNVDVLASPDMAEIKKMLDVDDTENGDLGYRLGSAFLVPYPNRIRGKLSADGKTLTTEGLRPGTVLWGTPARPLTQVLREIAIVGRLAKRGSKAMPKDTE